MKISKYIKSIMLFLLLTAAGTTNAQGVDAVRSLTWSAYESKLKKTTEAQAAVQAMLAADYAYVANQEKKLNTLLDSLNTYLNEGGDYLVIAAEAYGLFFEVQRLVANINNLFYLVKNSPENIIATSLSEKRSTVIMEVIAATTDLVLDIKKLFSSKNPMTEQERIKIIARLRPKLAIINKDLRKAEKTIRYTNLCYLWNEIRGKEYKFQKKTKAEIVQASLTDWKNNYKMKLK